MNWTIRAIPLRLVIVLILSPLGFPSVAQHHAPRYSEVTIPIKTGEADVLSALGISIDHPIVERVGDGWSVRVVLNESEMERLEVSTLDYTIDEPDLAAAYTTRPRATPPPSPLQGFDYGSMGGYYTLDELEDELDAMRTEYPNLISEKASIGVSIEGREIWMLRISNNPDVDESKPEALYTALHHAREPQSMATVVYFMYHLLENYGKDEEITDLVNTIEFYFVPVLNPDGYVFNEATNPDGGGFWRKNRRDHGGNVFGVDLNRNYDYLWGLNDEGSSPFPESQTYRGAEPFSEPEIAALRDFVEEHEFRTALNYHSRGEEYLYPWGYESGTYTADNALFVSTSEEMSADNGYEYGTGADVLYATNGSSDDWMYGEQTTKPKILSWTPEVCNRTTDGFWPPIERIIPIAQENIRANLAVARLARDLANPVSTEGGAPELTDGLTAYPNPTRSKLTVQVSDNVEYVVLTDLLGREVFRGIRSLSEVSIDTEGLAPGVYFVNAVGVDGTRVVKPVTILH